jgi:hypothetical protein
MIVAPREISTETTKSKKRQQRLTWKTRHVGLPWIRSALFNARLSEAP